MKCQRAIKMWKINPVTEPDTCFFLFLKNTEQLASNFHIHKINPIDNVNI